MRFLLALLLFLASGCMHTGDPGATAPALRVTTFNIRYGTAQDGVNAWPLRNDLVMEVIREEAPDVLGLQEALRFQLDEIEQAFPRFGEVGVGRDDGIEAGEYSAILYDRERLRLIEQGTFWLSDHPQQIASATWGNSIPRICSWAQFEDLLTNSTLHVFCTHWDHRSQESREQAAGLILARVHELAAGGPAIVMGDFNAGETNPAFMRLIGGETTVLFDSFRRAHPDATEVGTFNGFKGTRDGEKIDALLLSNHWQVETAAIVRSEREGRCPSDHYPVSASVTQAPR